MSASILGLSKAELKSRLMTIPAEAIVKAAAKVVNAFGVPKFLPVVETCGDGMDTDKRVAPPRYTICLLIWVAKFQTSHVLQSNKNNNYWGCCDRLSDSIIAKIVLQYWCQVEG